MLAGGLTLLLIAVCAAMIVANVCFKRERPIEPSDDVVGDVPNLSGFIFHSPPIPDERR